jgi:hypothetical protein
VDRADHVELAGVREVVGHGPVSTGVTVNESTR